jgi:hypothetical protein
MQIYILSNGAKTGPFDEGKIRSMISSQKLKPDAMMWYEGLSGWVRLSESEKFSDVCTLATIEQGLSEISTVSKGRGAAFYQLVVMASFAVLAYFLSEWLRGRLQADQVSGWFRGSMDGGIVAAMRWVQNMMGSSKPVYWNGPTSWGYHLSFWLNTIFNSLSFLSLLKRLVLPGKR